MTNLFWSQCLTNELFKNRQMALEVKIGIIGCPDDQSVPQCRKPDDRGIQIKIRINLSRGDPALQLLSEDTAHLAVFRHEKILDARIPCGHSQYFRPEAMVHGEAAVSYAFAHEPDDARELGAAAFGSLGHADCPIVLYADHGLEQLLLAAVINIKGALAHASPGGNILDRTSGIALFGKTGCRCFQDLFPRLRALLITSRHGSPKI